MAGAVAHTAGRQPVSQVNYTNFKFLSGFNGANGATSFTDESAAGKSITVVGNAQATTSSPLRGSASLLLDGNGDYVELSGNGDLDLQFGAAIGNITFACEFRRDTALSNTAHNFIMGHRTGTTGYSWFINTDGSIRFFMYDGTGVITVDMVSSAGVITANTATKAALTRGGSNWYMSVGGVLVASQTGLLAGAVATNNARCAVGRDPAGGGRFFSGRIDEFVVTHECLFTGNWAHPDTWPRS